MREPEDLLEREKARGVVYAERDCGDARDGEDPAQDLNGAGCFVRERQGPHAQDGARRNGGDGLGEWKPHLCLHRDIVWDDEPRAVDQADLGRPE